MAETEEKQKKNDKVVAPLKEWPARLKATLFILFVLLVVASLIVILKNDWVTQKIEETKEEFLDYVGQKAFALDDIILTGRERTTLSDINKIIGLRRGDNLLKVDVNILKQNLETLPWIRDVEVRRSFFPNILNIKIEEKKVLAIWQLNERFYPLDMEGYVIEAEYQPDKPILLIVGAGAAENILNLLNLIREADHKYLPRVKVANYISKRRWNIILDDIREGITIKLPEDNQEKAWKKLLKLDKEKGILKRKLTIIDLRLEDKVAVKLRKSRINARRTEHKL